MNWQPISEAPKDKTKVLLGRDAEICIGWWQEDIGCYYMNLGFGQDRFDPTHFMLISPSGEQRPESVNQRLLQAAERVRCYENVAVDGMVEGLEEPEDIANCRDAFEKLSAAIEAAKQATKGVAE